ncbi:MAG: hypothetical protein MUO31_07145 [Thermodesulfovibrionales bacterium]|nr:hypothetical protein [Thermodesulfovibrionales bacterium]
MRVRVEVQTELMMIEEVIAALNQRLAELKVVVTEEEPPPSTGSECESSSGFDDNDDEGAGDGETPMCGSTNLVDRMESDFDKLAACMGSDTGVIDEADFDKLFASLEGCFDKSNLRRDAPGS